MNLMSSELQNEYVIKAVDVSDEELRSFLFSLGVYAGEPITVISRKKSGCIVFVKNGRYSIDRDLAHSIAV